LITKRYKNVGLKQEARAGGGKKTNKENFKRMPQANPIKLSKKREGKTKFRFELKG
jgi:hypothetical protein